MADRPILPDVFHYRSLTAGITEISLKPRLLTDLILNKTSLPTVFSDTKNVEFDVQSYNHSLIPFMKRNDRAHLMKTDNYKHYIVEPPTMKESDDLTYDEIFTQRWADEPLTGVNRKKVASRIARSQMLIKERIENNIEWMLSQIVTTGEISYSGDYDRFDFDFEVPAANLSETATWSDSSSTVILNDLREWQKEIYSGTGSKNLIALATPDVVDAILENTGIKTLLDNRRLVIGNIDYGFPYIGNLNGVPIYEFEETILDEDGDETDLHGASDLFILLDPNSFQKFYAPSFNKNGPVMSEIYSYATETDDPQGIKIFAESHMVPVLRYRKGLIVATITV